MGKIYDALKKAEQEALLHKKEREVITNSPTPKLLPTSPVGIIPQASGRLKSDDELSLVDKKKALPSHSIPYNLVVLEQPNSFIAEQFKNLSARLLPIIEKGRIKTILITSSLAEEGKSTIASNLALCLAKTFNQHIFLMDTDFRNPSIKNIFALNTSCGGLVGFFDNEHSLPEIICKTTLPNLSIIPSERAKDNSTIYLASKKMKQLITEVNSRHHDSIIIFDSSPVQQTTEPRIIAEQVDGILLVVRAGRTNREVIKETVQLLGKEKILGVVFNDTSEINKPYYSDYYHNSLKKRNI